MFTTYRKTLTYSASSFIHKVYAWMFVGLLLTGLTATYLFVNPALLMKLLASRYALYGLMLAQISLVMYLSMRITRMSYFAAAAAFSSYSILMGITLTPVFLIYTMASIGTVCAVTAGMFGVTALYGYTTKTDLTRFSNVLFMGLVGLILATLVNIFLQSSAMDMLLSYLSVLLFTALTAYDMQKIQQLSREFAYHDEDDESMLSQKLALMGALTLYLDFINLFLALLKLLGKKRD